MTTSPKKLRVGILGAANIARAFIAGVKSSPLVEATAVASRDAAKAAAFAKETGVARSFGSYEALLADASIDAIYNPLPNTLHAEWSIKAVEAGKHVLCEKPLCMTGAEARAMFAAADKHKRVLVEAYPYLAQPMAHQVAELVAAGAIGPLRVIQANFGFTQNNPENIRLRPDVGGGSVWDAGSYPVSLVCTLANAKPKHVSAVARWAVTGVDNTLAATLEFESGLIAQVTSSMEAGFHRNAMIIGANGFIETQYLNHPPAGGASEIKIRRGIPNTTPIETVPVTSGDGFLAEAESFARAISGGMKFWNGATPKHSIDIADTLEAIARSAKERRPVDIPA